MYFALCAAAFLSSDKVRSQVGLSSGGSTDVRILTGRFDLRRPKTFNSLAFLNWDLMFFGPEIAIDQGRFYVWLGIGLGGVMRKTRLIQRSSIVRTTFLGGIALALLMAADAAMAKRSTRVIRTDIGTSSTLTSTSTALLPSSVATSNAPILRGYVPQATVPMMVSSNDNSAQMAMLAVKAFSVFAMGPQGQGGPGSQNLSSERGTNSFASGSGQRGSRADSPAGSGGSAPKQSTVVLAPNDDISTATYKAAKSLEDGEIGRGNGYSMSAAGWARLRSDGSITMSGPGTSHCTSATHAAFLKTIGILSQQGKVKLDDGIVKTLNSNLFRDTWNSNGYGPNKIIEVLGGQTFRDPYAAKKGDFVKIDRPNGTGHMGGVTRIVDGKICYWSSNSGTNGVGEQCESLSGLTLTFSRISDLAALNAGLKNLGSALQTDSAFADVRSRGGNGFVKASTLALARTDGRRQVAQADGEPANAVQ